MSESVLVQLSNGSLMANMRNDQHARGVSISKDGGKTFQNVTYDATLISPVGLFKIYASPSIDLHV